MRADFRALETHVYAPDWALTVPISCVAGKFDMCVGGNPSVGRLGKDAMKALEEVLTVDIPAVMKKFDNPF